MMKQIKQVRAAAVAILLVSTAGAEATGQQRIDGRAVAAAPDATVKITNAVGSVRVVGWDNDSVVVQGTLGAGSGPLEISGEPRAVTIRVPVSQDAHELSPTHLEVRVPRRNVVAVRTSTADIKIQDVEGGLDLESVSGRISVRGRPRMVYAESAGGDVIIDVATKIVRARSVNGNVTVLNARGYLEASTVSGVVNVQGNGLWEGEITSISGNIQFEGDFDSGGSFYFETHSGALELVLPSSIRADFDITTLAGAQVANDFGPDSAGRFAANGGGTLIRVKSFKGQIRILKR
jgi:hypothetical protein